MDGIEMEEGRKKWQLCKSAAKRQSDILIVMEHGWCPAAFCVSNVFFEGFDIGRTEMQVCPELSMNDIPNFNQKSLLSLVKILITQKTFPARNSDVLLEIEQGCIHGNLKWWVFIERTMVALSELPIF